MSGASEDSVVNTNGDEFVGRRRRLVRNLRLLRLNKGLSGRSLASVAGMSQSKISKIETERATPSAADVLAYCDALDVAADVQEELLALARSLALEWVSLPDHTTDEQYQRAIRIRDLEREAKRLDVFSPTCIPALLQTPAYATAVLRSCPAWVSGRNSDPYLVTRVERQAQLYNSEKSFRFLVPEGVLRAVYESTDLVDDQLDALRSWAERPNVQIGVLPFGRPLSRSPWGPFLTVDDALVNVELATAEVFLQRPLDVEAYVDLFSSLWKDASKDEDATRLYQKAQVELRSAIDLTSTH